MSDENTKDSKLIRFSVLPTRMTFSKEDFRIYACKVDKKKYPNIKHHPKYHNVSIMGAMQELDFYTAYDVIATEGRSRNDDSVVYNVKRIEIAMPTNYQDTKIFLEHVLTPSQAAEILKIYPNIIELVKSDQLNLLDDAKLYNIGPQRLERVKALITQNFNNYSFFAYFRGCLSTTMFNKICSDYTSIELVKQKLNEDPYLFFTNLKGVGYKTADEVIEALINEGVLEFDFDMKTSSFRCMAAVRHILSEFADSGHTKARTIDVFTRLKEFAPETAQHFKEIVNDPTIHVSEDKSYIALSSFYDDEKYIVDYMTEWVSYELKDSIDVEKYKKQPDFELSDEQMDFLRAVMNQSVTILTAPAGTGKSAVTGALVQALVDNKESFALMTPTGKSAKVLSQYTKHPASTIHKKLGYNGTEFDAPAIEEKFIIIDEFSMCDIWLFKHVLERINPKMSKLVIVGDNEQLPSVSAGNLLHDFINSGKIPVSRLSKVFRYGSSGLLTVATDIRYGREYLTYDDHAQAIGDARDYIFYPVPDDNIFEEATKLYTRIISGEKINGNSYTLDDVAILSAYNVGPLGTRKFNEAIQAQLHKFESKKLVTHAAKPEDQMTFYIGDIVMQIVNNYKVPMYDSNPHPIETVYYPIMNGETGRVVDIVNNSLVVQFDKVTVVYTKQLAHSQLLLGYSISIHRVQGSGIKLPIVVTPSAHKFFLTSNALYVGITRSTTQCIHLGNVDTVNFILKKKENFNRATNTQDLFKSVDERLVK